MRVELSGIESNISLKQKKEILRQEVSDKKNDKILAGSLAALSVLGLTAVGLLKTRTTSFEDALKKSGVILKDNIATIANTGERFTGKIERYTKRNRKETTQYIDGIITEKVYHNAFGKEIEGYFYKNGMLRFRVNLVNRGNRRYVMSTEFKDNNKVSNSTGIEKEKNTTFDAFRTAVKNIM